MTTKTMSSTPVSLEEYLVTGTNQILHLSACGPSSLTVLAVERGTDFYPPTTLPLTV